MNKRGGRLSVHGGFLTATRIRKIFVCACTVMLYSRLHFHCVATGIVECSSIRKLPLLPDLALTLTQLQLREKTMVLEHPDIFPTDSYL
jgi:hypothetical protein